MAGDDGIVLQSHTEKTAAHISNATLVLMKDATHYPAWEQTKAFDTVVLNFLKAQP